MIVSSDIYNIHLIIHIRLRVEISGMFTPPLAKCLPV